MISTSTPICLSVPFYKLSTNRCIFYACMEQLQKQAHGTTRAMHTSKSPAHDYSHLNDRVHVLPMINDFKVEEVASSFHGTALSAAHA